MKRLLAICMIMVMAAGTSACAAHHDESTTAAPTVTASNATAATTTKAVTQATTVSEDATQQKSFDDWTDTDLTAYFKTNGIFSNDAYYMLQTGEAVPDGVTSIISYDDFAEGNISVTIFYFEKDSENSKTEAIFNRIKEQKKYVWHAENNDIQPFNAVIGRFAVFYELSLDKAFKQQFESALDNLIKEENITPAFYDKGIDISDFYKGNDEVIVVESDDE